jgi:hypothetical protein
MLTKSRHILSKKGQYPFSSIPNARRTDDFVTLKLLRVQFYGFQEKIMDFNALTDMLVADRINADLFLLILQIISSPPILQADKGKEQCQNGHRGGVHSIAKNPGEPLTGCYTSTYVSLNHLFLLQDFPFLLRWRESAILCPTCAVGQIF